MIDNSVSILYWPTQRRGDPTGHVELELEGRCYSFFDDLARETVPLRERIEKARTSGLPFIQFHVNVSQDQLISLREKITKPVNCFNCSIGTYKKLANQAQFNEFPSTLSIFPSIFALALYAAHKRNPSKIHKVSFHGNRTLGSSVKAACPGVLFESVLIGFTILSIALLTRTLYKITLE